MTETSRRAEKLTTKEIAAAVCTITAFRVLERIDAEADQSTAAMGEPTMFRCTAKDANGIPRCYGIDHTEQKAETQARWAVKQYVTGRREMRFEDFTFETEILAE